MYWHRLTPGLVTSLLKLRDAIKLKDDNDVDIHNEMSLTTTEAMNWTKLRFHGLVAKRKVNGAVVRGHWVLTNRGGEFLRGRSLPARVKTLNNHVINHDTETVTILDLSDIPRFEDIATIERESVPLELTQAGLFS